MGDKTYGIKNQKFNLDGQLLHAFKLELTHPTTAERMSFNAEIPEMADYLDAKNDSLCVYGLYQYFQVS